MARGVFLFLFFGRILPINSLITSNDMPSAFSDFEASYLRSYWLQCSSLLKSCSARLLMTEILVSENVSPRNY